MPQHLKVTVIIPCFNEEHRFQSEELLSFVQKRSWLHFSLVDDDDDGDLSNGTPHGSQIFQAFGHHGLLPAIDMAMLVPTNPEPAAPGQPIEWTLELDNHDPWTQVVDVWVKTHDRIFLVSEDLTILPGKSQVELTGKIPGNAPSGTYTVDTVAGIEGYGRAIPAAAATFQVTIP